MLSVLFLCALCLCVCVLYFCRAMVPWLIFHAAAVGHNSQAHAHTQINHPVRSGLLKTCQTNTRCIIVEFFKKNNFCFLKILSLFYIHSFTIRFFWIYFFNPKYFWWRLERIVTTWNKLGSQAATVLVLDRFVLNIQDVCWFGQYWKGDINVVKYVYIVFKFFSLVMQDEDFVTRDDFEDADQLRIGNDGIFMLTFFSKENNVYYTSINLATTLFSVFFEPSF